MTRRERNGLEALMDFAALLPFAFVLGTCISALKTYRKKKLLAEAKETAVSSDPINLSWDDFEYLVGEALREGGLLFAECRRRQTGNSSPILLPVRRRVYIVIVRVATPQYL